MNINYTPLVKIAIMDFSEMRTVVIKDTQTCCATNEAIFFFTDNLNEFFKQFSNRPPEKSHLEKYSQLITKITASINRSEYQYFYSKYYEQYHDSVLAQQMATDNQLKSFKDIPTRMQYWASSAGWGSTIRNACEHQKAIKSLSQWARLISDIYNVNSNFFKYIDEVELYKAHDFKSPKGVPTYK